MKIKHVKLRYFRNYDCVDFEATSRLSFLMGDNAQGKTNFLEALYFLSTMRSFRTSTDFDLVSFGQDFAKMHIVFERNHQENELNIVISKQGKYVVYNGQSMVRISDVIGQLNTVVFSPLDLKFIFGSPRDRRKFIDMELGKISPSYLNDLLLAQKLLKERNAHLRSHFIDSVYMDVITTQLVEVDVKLIQARAVFLQLLEEHCSTIYKTITGQEVMLKIRYHSCIPVTSVEGMKQELLKMQKANLDRDKEQRMTCIGSHREDFTMQLGELDVQTFASQGQRRSVVLALKIGLLHVAYRKIKEFPVLLLDDVLSELDETHRIRLFQSIPSQAQVFVTATDMSDKEKKQLHDRTFYLVKQGTVNKEE